MPRMSEQCVPTSAARRSSSGSARHEARHVSGIVAELGTPTAPAAHRVGTSSQEEIILAAINCLKNHECASLAPTAAMLELHARLKALDKKESPPHRNASPPKPRGSYIQAAGGRTYWFNYDDPLDLRRLPEGSADNTNGVSTAGHMVQARTVSREVHERCRRVAGSSVGQEVHRSNSLAAIATECCGRGGAAAPDIDESDEEAPSPSPDEPLLPETPVIARQRPTRPEVVPKLWGIDDERRVRQCPEARVERISTPGWGRGADPNTSTGVHRSGSVTSNLGASSCCSLRTPSVSTTPRRQAPLRRRHLSAPRLLSNTSSCMSRELITPRCTSPEPQRSGPAAVLPVQQVVPKLQLLSATSHPATLSNGMPQQVPTLGWQQSQPQTARSSSQVRSESYSVPAIVTTIQAPAWVSSGALTQRPPPAPSRSTTLEAKVIPAASAQRWPSRYRGRLTAPRK